MQCKVMKCENGITASEFLRGRTSRIFLPVVLNNIPWLYPDRYRLDVLVELAKPAFAGSLDERTTPPAYRERKCLVTY